MNILLINKTRNKTEKNRLIQKEDLVIGNAGSGKPTLVAINVMSARLM